MIAAEPAFGTLARPSAPVGPAPMAETEEAPVAQGAPGAPDLAAPAAMPTPLALPEIVAMLPAETLPPDAAAPPSAPARGAAPAQAAEAPAPAAEAVPPLAQSAPGPGPAAPPPPILARPAPLAPAAGLDRASGVTLGRLPRIGAAPAPAPVTPAAATDVAANDAAATDAPPLRRFARAFDNPAGKPVFAIVLMDTGEPTLDRNALAGLPFPVTFALDPKVPGADLAASIYRDGGQEVVILAQGLPEGAVAADIEVAFEAFANSLPEAVAVMDAEAAGFQDNRLLAGQVVPVLRAQGRGLLSWDRGLNAAAQVARREGLAAATILRRIDAGGESPTIMRRYLDRAAFKAVQDGRVVVAGTTRPETVAVLLEWAVEGRAASVALAPVSAVVRP